MTTHCEICGATNVPVRHALVAWKQPVFGPFEDVDRCIDVNACRTRVQEAGQPWPIREQGAAR